MGDIKFTAEDLAACEKFCKEVEALLRAEAKRCRIQPSLRTTCSE